MYLISEIKAPALKAIAIPAPVAGSGYQYVRKIDQFHPKQELYAVHKSLLFFLWKGEVRLPQNILLFLCMPSVNQ